MERWDFYFSRLSEKEIKKNNFLKIQKGLQLVALPFWYQYWLF